MTRPPRSRPRQFPICSPDATCSASPRPAPARRRLSPCRSCSACRPPMCVPPPARARALILTPTRELASQIGDNFRTYGRNLPLRHTLVFGGVGQRPQVDALARGVDILVATPGRLLDLLNQRFVRLDAIEILVLDEADRMFDMGFIRDVKQDHRAPPRSSASRCCFSATMPDRCRTSRARASGRSGPRRSDAPGHHGRAHQAARLSRRRRQQACAAGRSAQGKGARRASSSSPAPSTAPTRWPSISPVRASPPTRSTATRASRRASGRSRISAPVVRGFWSPPTSPRAASMSTASPMSSISNCRKCRKAMSTASAAPRARAPRAWRCPSAP